MKGTPETKITSVPWNLEYYIQLWFVKYCVRAITRHGQTTDQTGFIELNVIQ